MKPGEYCIVRKGRKGAQGKRTPTRTDWPKPALVDLRAAYERDLETSQTSEHKAASVIGGVGA